MQTILLTIYIFMLIISIISLCLDTEKEKPVDTLLALLAVILWPITFPIAISTMTKKKSEATKPNSNDQTAKD
jgi:ABC-type transport system involved in cytochrome c biogenesis permease component